VIEIPIWRFKPFTEMANSDGSYKSASFLMRLPMMSEISNEDIKRWTVRRKSTLVLDIIQGKTTIQKASQAFDLPASQIEHWVEDGKRGLENGLRMNPLYVKEQYERRIKDLQQAYGEAMLELRVWKKPSPLCDEEEK